MKIKNRAIGTIKEETQPIIIIIAETRAETVVDTLKYALLGEKNTLLVIMMISQRVICWVF